MRFYRPSLSLPSLRMLPLFSDKERIMLKSSPSIHLLFYTIPFRLPKFSRKGGFSLGVEGP
jgi:hypothetical protein